MVILNTWQEYMLGDAFGKVLFVFTIIITLGAWVITFKCKDFGGVFPGFLGTMMIFCILWANQTPDTYHIVDVSNASFLEVYNNYEIIGQIEGSPTLYKVKEKIHESD